MDTCINYCEPGYAFMSSDERKWINHLKTVAKSHPECVILNLPEDNDGFIYARFPQKWVKVSPPKKMSMTDEQRAERARKLQEGRARKQRLKEENDG